MPPGDALTPEQIKKLQEQNESYKKTLDGLNTTLGNVTKSYSINANAFTDYAATIIPSTQSVEAAFTKMIEVISPLTAMEFLEDQAVALQNAFGVSKLSLNEFKESVANVVPEIIAMGYNGEKATEIIKDIASSLGTTGVVGKEAITELGAASKLSNIGVSELAQNFRNVGVSIYNVGEEMFQVADYAKSVGVSVEAVSKGVVANLEKMNLYNFENGTKGLTKMAAQAARLGFDMGETFRLAEKVFNPEGAIELAAGLQRLGVASSQLLDPLRAMDLAQNDPEELQNEIVELTKTFTKFNQETNKFEILPGEKRRLREIASEMGILPEKLAEMSIKAADFDMKMKSIEFPTANKEQQELIAGLAQIKDGKAMIEVKDEKGERKLKEVKQLSPEDIKRLQEQQEDSSKTIEELAVDQLDQMTYLNKQVNALASKVGLGVATSPEILRAQQAGNILTKSLFEQGNKQLTVEGMKNFTSDLVGPLEKSILSVVSTGGDETSIEEVMKQFTELPQKISEAGASFVIGIQTTFKEAYQQVGKELNELYFPKKGGETDSKKTVDINLNVKLEGDENTRNFDGTKLTDLIIGNLQSNSNKANQMVEALNINYLES